MAASIGSDQANYPSRWVAGVHYYRKTLGLKITSRKEETFMHSYHPSLVESYCRGMLIPQDFWPIVHWEGMVFHIFREKKNNPQE